MFSQRQILSQLLSKQGSVIMFVFINIFQGNTFSKTHFVQELPIYEYNVKGRLKKKFG